MPAKADWSNTPEEFVALGNVRVRTSDPVWVLKRYHNAPSHISVRVSRIQHPYVDAGDVSRLGLGLIDEIPCRESTLSAELRHLILAFLVHEAMRHTGKHVATVSMSLAWFEAWIYGQKLKNPGETAVEDLPDLIAGFAAHSRRLRRPACWGIRSFYKWARLRRVPGFDRPTWLRVRGERFFRRRAGRIAKLADPRRGALSIPEQRMLRQALLNPTPRTDERDLAVAWLHHDIGFRSNAAAKLKRDCVHRSVLGDQCFVDAPRSKRREPTHATSRHEISPELGDLLERIAASHESEWLLPWLRDLKPYQKVSDLVGEAMDRFVRSNSLTTIRVPPRKTRWGVRPDWLRLRPYRLRYTLATNLHLQGASPEQIAAMLGDDTVEMALIYSNLSSSMVDVLEKTLDEHPLWRRTILREFQGKIAHRGELFPNPIFAGAPNLPGFATLRRQELEIGGCRNSDPCVKHPPVTCYRCAFFKASRDPQPHMAQYKQILDDVRAGIGRRSDRMAAVALPDLLAIRDLIDRLEVRSACSRTSEAIMKEEIGG